MGRVDGKVALVTGGGSGIGRASAIRLAEEGARLVITGRNEANMQETVNLIEKAGGQAFFIHHDVTSEEDWKAVMQATDSYYAQLDILVNNAGVWVIKPTAATTLEEFEWQNRVNVNSVFLGIKYGVAEMEKSGGGSIINISSIAGLVGAALSPGYCSSKGAARLLSKACALECAQNKNNIRVNTIFPGPIKTDMLETAGGSDAIMHAFADMSPVGHVGEPLDIANGVLYLASEESKYVTGADLVIDAGLTAA